MIYTCVCMYIYTYIKKQVARVPKLAPHVSEIRVSEGHSSKLLVSNFVVYIKSHLRFNNLILLRKREQFIGVKFRCVPNTSCFKSDLFLKDNSRAKFHCVPKLAFQVQQSDFPKETVSDYWCQISLCT
jgi:hypothetical protein